MNRLKGLITLVLLTITGTLSVSAQVEDYSRLRVFGGSETVSELKQMGICLDHGIKVKKGHYLEGDFHTNEVVAIEESGLQYEVIHQNTFKHIQKLREAAAYKNLNSECGSNIADYPIPSNFTTGSMAGFYTYQELLDHLDNMLNKFPDLITAKTPIGDFETHEGRPIYYIKISDNPGVDEKDEESQVLYTSLHHSREPASLSVLIYYMYYLLENYDTDISIRDMVDSRELYFVPCVNPDGYIYNEMIQPNGGGMWRKNKRDNNMNDSFSENIDGVDLNRNYDYFWGLNDEGSSPDFQSNTYRGPFEASEPEVQALAYLCEQNEFLIAMNYHSHGNYLIYPWSYQAIPPADSLFFRAFAIEMAKENGYLHGTVDETLGYSVNGDSDDWMYGEEATKNKILAFTPEVGSETDWFWPNTDRIIPICQENMWQNLTSTRLTGNYAIFSENNPVVLTELEGNLNFELTKIGLADGGNFSVTVEGIGLSALAGVYTVQIDNPAHFDPVQETFPYILDPAIQSGDLIKFLVTVDNGEFPLIYTISKYYASEPVVETETASNLDNWSNSGWGLTTLDFVSPPASLTDSPVGEYENNHNSQIIWQQNLDLTNAQFAQLNFWAKWDIEAFYDYVQVIAIDSDINTETALCGRYTSIGNEYLGPEAPVYDGTMQNWVEESISLSDFIGTNIQIKFVFSSDPFVQGDGFYLDDINTLIVEDEGTGIGSIANTDWNHTVVPNPNAGRFSIEYELTDLKENTELIITDISGRRIAAHSINSNTGSIDFDTEKFHSGIYLYHFADENQQSSIAKIIIIK